ncbi:hypothetical protein ACXYX3_17800 [Mycobacterium sp. C3-094]
MSRLAAAVLELACQATIYACERIIEQLHARRPLHDEPLPGGAMECDGPMAADTLFVPAEWTSTE